MIIFVGDEPSKLNIDPNIAFIGSKSMIALEKWLDYLAPAQFLLLNSHNPSLINRIYNRYRKGDTVIALGNKASERLAKYDIEHFKLPHPSPRNRKLNNRLFIENELKLCKKYMEAPDARNIAAINLSK